MTIANRIKYGKLVGVDPNTTDAHEQLLMFRAYIKGHGYGTAENALAFHEAYGFY